VMEYAPTAETTQADYRLVTTELELDELTGELESSRQFALRVLPDTTALVHAGIVGIAFSTAPQQARYVPVRHAGMHSGPQVTLEQALRRLKPVLENPAIEKLGHDLKSDSLVLARHGVTLRGLSVDTMLASYLLDATRSGHPLETSSLEYL